MTAAKSVKERGRDSVSPLLPQSDDDDGDDDGSVLSCCSGDE